jgi:hypothetical protein
MQLVGEEVARLLRLRGYASRTAVWRSGGCEVIAAERRGEIYAVAVDVVDDIIYGKVAPGSSSVSLMRCSEILYSPWGLYVFARIPEEFAAAVGRKMVLILGK